jgi:iron-sulfur cluster repair protein YtfE (RIC family)
MSEANTSTRQVAVNAAFLKEIKEDNLLLKSLWDRISPLAAHIETATNHWPELITLLSDLRDQLAIHFTLEEAYGYFDDAIDIAPQLSLQAENLRGQHRNLFEQIRDLADRVTEVSIESEQQSTAFMKRFRRFRQDLENHEEEELKLILESLDDDLGVGD